MGKISAKLTNNQIIVTRYESDGYVIPKKISQEKNVIAIIDKNIDTDADIGVLEPEYKAVPRRDFIIKLLTSVEDIEDSYSVYAKGLYSSRDMGKGITWAEVAYLLYYVGKVDRLLDWRDIKPDPNYHVCVLQEIVDNRKVLNEKLAMYKNRIDMESYINSIISGKRYIPLPLYCAYVELISNPDLNLELSIGSMFKKVSEKDLGYIF